MSGEERQESMRTAGAFADRLTHMAMRARIAVVIPLALVAACRSANDKADRYEQAYDYQMSVGAHVPAMMSMARAVKYNDSEPRYWTKLGRVQEMLQRHGEAAQSYQRALDMQPDNVEALETLAVLSVRSGQFASANRFIDPLLLIQPNDLNGLLAKGVLALHNRKFADADQIATQIISNAPDQSAGYVLRARALDAQDKTRAAAALLESRVAINPDDRDTVLQLLTFYQKLGDRSGIRATAIRLSRLLPDDPRYALEAARAFHGLGKDDRARATIASLGRRFPGDVSVMIAVAHLWRDIAPLAAARNEIAAIAGNARPRIKAALANELIYMGDPARALALVEPLAGGDVTSANVDAVAAAARASYALGRTAEVERRSDALLAFDAENPTGLLLRARLELKRGRYDSAVTDAQRAASGDFNNEEASLLIAQIYTAQNNQVLAVKAFGDARQRFPNSTTVLRAEGDWLIAQGRAPDATRRAGEFARAHPDRSEAWIAYRDTCRAVGNAACAREAAATLARFA